MTNYSTRNYIDRTLLPVCLIGILLIGWVILFSACRSAADTNRHPRAPEAGTYRSSMMKAWLTVTPYAAGDPRAGTTTPNVDYGVGSMSIKGMFGDLIIQENGTYTLTGDKRGGTWTYIPEKDSVGFTGILGIFRIRYDYKQDYITIYTGGAKMDDGGEVNIRYTKKRAKSAAN